MNWHNFMDAGFETYVHVPNLFLELFTLECYNFGCFKLRHFSELDHHL